MSIKMRSVTFRADSSKGQVEDRVPVDVLARALGRVYPILLPAIGVAPEMVLSIRIAPFVKFSLRVSDPNAARFRRASVDAQLQLIYSGIRAGAVEISQRQAVALSGEIYRQIVDRCQENPGSPEHWEAFKAFTYAARQGLISNPPAMPKLSDWAALDERLEAEKVFGAPSGEALLDSLGSLEEGESAFSLERRFGMITSWVLAQHGIEATPASRLRLLERVADAALDAGWAMKRAAQGDYSVDPKASRFPPIKPRGGKDELTITQLFEHWKTEAKPVGSTITTWKATLKSLREHLGHDCVSQIRRVDVQEWKDKLVRKGYSPGTINGTYLACLQALLAHAARNDLIADSVASGVKVKVAKRAGTSMLPYEDAEVAKLLRIAANQSDPARKWLPLLAACTGARVGELAQLWGDRVRIKDGVLVLELRPARDGGSLKNEGSERDVPVHQALIDAGFLAFAESRRGPLFYGQSSGQGARHASKGTANHLSDWIRKQPGFDDPRKAPMHALRHWWKTAAAKVGVPDSHADFIQGHAEQGAAARYRHFDLRTLKHDVDCIPVPRV